MTRRISVEPSIEKDYSISSIRLAANAPLLLLVVEDSPADVFLVKAAMEKEGLDVQIQVAEDGEQAITMIDRVDAMPNVPRPRVMLVDLNVPRVGGHEVLRHVRRSPRCRNTPVVIMTSSDSESDRAAAADLGAEYFRKPSSLAEFMGLGKLIRRLSQVG